MIGIKEIFVGGRKKIGRMEESRKKEEGKEGCSQAWAPASPGWKTQKSLD